MEKKNQPAFPFWQNQTQTEAETGLTKREYFAAMAMQGIMSNSVIMEAFAKSKSGKDSVKAIAEDAVNQADELLKQLETPTP